MESSDRTLTFPFAGGQARVLRYGWIAAMAVVTASSQVSWAKGPEINLSLTLGQNQSTLDNSTVFTPRLRFDIPTSDEIWFNLEWGLTTVSLVSEVEDSRAVVTDQIVGLLNPNVGVSYGVESERLEFDIGMGLAFPVADADQAERRDSYLIALGAVSAWNRWLYQPNTFSINLPVRAFIDFGPFLAGVDGAFFVLIPTENTGERSAEFAAQAAIEAYAPVSLFDLGMRVQTVQVGESFEGSRYLQTSLAPLVRLHLGSIAEIRMQFNFNFGSPDGVNVDNRNTWGMTIGSEVRL